MLMSVDGKRLDARTDGVVIHLNSPVNNLQGPIPDDLGISRVLTHLRLDYFGQLN